MKGSRADVRAIKEKTDVVALISRYVSLTKAGSSYKGKCPFHKDDTPSFMVSEEKGLWHCFGCGEGGDAIGFLMKIENLSFIEAAKRLAQEAGVPFETGQDGEREKMLRVMAEAQAGFVSNLTGRQGKRARDYFLSRGYDEAAWDRFGLGYALPGWDHLKKALGSRYDAKLLVELGLLVQGKENTYDRFRDRTIFPIHDLSGHPIGFGGRAFEGEPKYLNSPKTPLFDKGDTLYGLSWARESLGEEQPTAVLVEGYTDVLSLHCVGLTTAVGSMGTALTKGQADLLARFAKSVVIAYDRDAAGGAAALRGMQVLRNSGLAVRVAQLGEGEDPDSLARKGGADAVREAIERAVPFYQYYVNSLKERHDVSSIFGKESAIAEARDFCRGIRSLPLRQEFAQALADVLDLPAEGILREMISRRRITPPQRVLPNHDRWTPEEDLLVLLLRDSIPWSRVASMLSPEDFSPANRPIAEALANLSESHNISEVVEGMDEESSRRASRYALADVRFSDVEKVVQDALLQLVQLPAIERRLADVGMQIAECERTGDRNRWNELTREKIKLVAERLARKGMNGRQGAQEDRSEEAAEQARS